MSAKEPPKIRWLVEPYYDDDGVQRRAGIDNLGREHGDPVPLSPPVGLSVSQGDGLHDQLKKMFAVEKSRFQMLVEAEQFESEFEANDFIVEDDLFPPGSEPWEDQFEMPDPPEPNGSQLASAAVNGGSATQNAPPQGASQIASSGSVSTVSPNSTVETQKPGVSGVGVGDSGVLGVPKPQ